MGHSPSPQCLWVSPLCSGSYYAGVTISPFPLMGPPRWLTVKNPSAMQKTMQIQSLGPEDSLEEEMATHSSILAWEISRTEEPGGLPFMGPQIFGYD